MQSRFKAGIIFLSAIIVLIACEDFVKSSYRTLATMGATYEAVMSSTAELYKQGIIPDAVWKEAAEKGDAFWAAYHSAVDALEAYAQVEGAASKDRVMVALDQVSEKLRNLETYLEPFIKPKEESDGRTSHFGIYRAAAG